MLLLNFQHACKLIWDMRHVEFSKELDQLYHNLFSRYMSRVKFQLLADKCLLRKAKAGSVIRQEGDLVTDLIFVVEGVVEVQRNGVIINLLAENEILQSVEWVKSNLNPDDCRLMVSYVAATDVTYVKIVRETLIDITQEKGLKAAVLTILQIKVAELWLHSIERKVKTVGHHKGVECSSLLSSTSRSSLKIPTPQMRSGSKLMACRSSRKNSPSESYSISIEEKGCGSENKYVQLVTLRTMDFTMSENNSSRHH